MAETLIGLVANSKKEGAAEILDALAGALTKPPVQPLLEASSARLVGREDGLPLRELAAKVDLLVVLGGDGTILQVLHELREEIKPVLGINIGSLGFLTCAASDDWREAAEAIRSGDYRTVSRSIVTAELFRNGDRIGKTHYGLNDAVVSRGRFSKTVMLEARVNGKFLSTYNADGLIVATPTGSTAYSISAGGPVIHPRAKAFVITPVCPHTLTNRSIVIDDDSIIDIHPCGEEGEILFAVDGHSIQPISADMHVQVRKAPFAMPLAMLTNQSFFHILQTKLRWHGSNV